ncbi:MULTISPECIES: TadE family protein [unclassified Methylobacterium]|uniref:TadE/TadG family type IV pilus assembly protein n=1 Tax=unclassified Methylobacterium TaxID=2615210 RepID=UPI0006FBD7A6|nr:MULTISPECIES: TadE family protein [unclassified Methylobacterium]KQT78221.1 hypothetical protein ASG59_09600 [Methylobacterium sp. Leaf466]
MTTAGSAVARTGAALRRCATRGRSIGSDRTGAAAVEFAMIALPMLMTFLVILEVALMYWMGHAMDNATEIAARKISSDTLVAAPSGQTPSTSALRTEICGQIGALFNCDSIRIHLRTFDTLSTASVALPIDPATRAWSEGFGTTSDCPRDGAIAVLQVAAEFVGLSGLSLGHEELANGNRVLQAAYTFRIQDGLGLPAQCAAPGTTPAP